MKIAKTRDGNHFGLTFGATAPKIAQQLKEQGQHAPLKIRLLWQKIHDGITLAAVQGVLTDGEKHRAYSRLFTKISEEMD